MHTNKRTRSPTQTTNAHTHTHHQADELRRHSHADTEPVTQDRDATHAERSTLFLYSCHPGPAQQVIQNVCAVPRPHVWFVVLHLVGKIWRASPHPFKVCRLASSVPRMVNNFNNVFVCPRALSPPTQRKVIPAVEGDRPSGQIRDVLRSLVGCALHVLQQCQICSR